MPELAELKIMSDFINQNTKNKKVIKSYHVEKGNSPKEFNLFGNLKSESNGKELILEIDKKSIFVFMGMSGNWKYVDTNNWNQTKYTRLRFDMEDNKSLLLYGGFMGPKYSVGYPFKSSKRGYDPTKRFEDFKNKITDNIHKKVFKKPICEVLLNQEYFNGIGNYLRSTILYYLDVNPFESGDVIIKENPKILDMCKEIPLKAYKLNGGQLKDWKNPFDYDSKEFDDWVYYQKGYSCKDNLKRTFWFDPKWEKYCPYLINKRNKNV